MADLKLFRIASQDATELVGSGADVEKSLQTLVERHLGALLAVQMLESEYSTGRTHGGRIDTLGIDENGSPVIIEYKRSRNQNVINQGLFYLDWLLDHRGEFELLVGKRIGSEHADAIDWSSPRLICIAGDFTRYDEHAVQQINRNIELVRYRQYESGQLLLLELVNAATSEVGKIASGEGQAVSAQGSRHSTATSLLGKASPELTALFNALRDYCEGLGDDVHVKALKHYFAFRRLKNFACVEVHPVSADILAYVKVDPTYVDLRDGFTRDVRGIGHYGTGDLEIRLKTEDDLEAAKELLLRSYEAN
ncbi:MAG: DUF91 domain-containing protein [Thermoleophilales bacterium]|nr:DUF91 domain-containing protein [Thermoleophilales bacterium]